MVLCQCAHQRAPAPTDTKWDSIGTATDTPPTRPMWAIPPSEIWENIDQLVFLLFQNMAQKVCIPGKETITSGWNDLDTASKIFGISVWPVTCKHTMPSLFTDCCLLFRASGPSNVPMDLGPGSLTHPSSSGLAPTLLLHPTVSMHERMEESYFPLIPYNVFLRPPQALSFLQDCT